MRGRRSWILRRGSDARRERHDCVVYALSVEALDTLVVD